jgi:hypothetical protein
MMMQAMRLTLTFFAKKRHTKGGRGKNGDVEK